MGTHLTPKLVHFLYGWGYWLCPLLVSVLGYDEPSGCGCGEAGAVPGWWGHRQAGFREVPAWNAAHIPRGLVCRRGQPLWEVRTRRAE